METINIVVVGAGGHASVIISMIHDVINNGSKISIKGLLDDRVDLKHFNGYKVLDKIENIDLYNDKNTRFILAIGNCNTRKYIAQKNNNLKYYTLIHQTAIISESVQIKEGTVVMPGAIINCNSSIGSHVIINTGAIVEHDNKIGDFSHISPGAILCGGVDVGEATHIGAGCKVIQYKKIGNNTVLGAGSVVINDIKSNVTAVGTPAVTIKIN